MKDISILLPTCRRPQLPLPPSRPPQLPLTALDCVARLPGSGRIGEVLVMENGLDRGSEEVCRRFSNLPIKYIYRDPVVPAETRTTVTFREASLPLVAVLHDDDWWDDFHLARSVASLEQHP